MALVSKERSRFGHTVADRVRELDAAEAVFHLRVEGCASHNELPGIAAEGLLERSAHLLEDELVDSGDGGEYLDGRFAEHWFERRLVHLLEHERNGDYQIWLHVLHSLEQQGRSRSLAEEVNGSAAAEWVDELEYEAVDVGHREHRNQFVTFVNRKAAKGEVNGSGNALVAEHNSLRCAGCA